MRRYIKDNPIKSAIISVLAATLIIDRLYDINILSKAYYGILGEERGRIILTEFIIPTLALITALYVVVWMNVLAKNLRNWKSDFKERI